MERDLYQEMLRRSVSKSS